MFKSKGDWLESLKVKKMKAPPVGAYDVNAVISLNSHASKTFNAMRWTSNFADHNSERRQKVNLYNPFAPVDAEEEQKKRLTPGPGEYDYTKMYEI